MHFSIPACCTPFECNCKEKHLVFRQQFHTTPPISGNHNQNEVGWANRFCTNYQWTPNCAAVPEKVKKKKTQKNKTTTHHINRFHRLLGTIFEGKKCKTVLRRGFYPLLVTHFFYFSLYSVWLYFSFAYKIGWLENICRHVVRRKWWEFYHFCKLSLKL